MKHVRTIFLIGFSGSGKSTIGPPLAKKLRAEFYDTDEMIERFAGKAIDRIFADDGEAAFRAMESDIIRQLAGNSSRSRVIALGGGAFDNGENRDLIKACGCTVYLQTAVPVILKRLGDDPSRPLLQVKPKRGESQQQAVVRRISGLLNKRKPHYRQSDLTVSTSKLVPAEVVKEIGRRLEGYYGSH